MAILQTAVFVDAGYLLTTAACLLTGRPDRDVVRVSIATLRDLLAEEAASVEPAARLLRIYWYDGVAREGRTEDQDRIALTEGIKFRAGTISGSGQQKGVDSLIVTDMIELARAGAITDAVLITGDEDVRVAVERVQAYGVRVHLVGIAPVRDNQSRTLAAEVDTRNEWHRDEVGDWLAIFPRYLEPPKVERADWIGDFLVAVRQQLHPTYLHSLAVAHAQGSRQLPAEFDRLLLGVAGNALGRPLDQTERETLRAQMVASLAAPAPAPAPAPAQDA